MRVIHHGALHGVTGSCHQLVVDATRSILIDCGLFQGEDAKGRDETQIDFSLAGIKSLILTHIHIDHVGRLPHLMAAGFDGPIYCTAPTAKLLPLTIEDAMRVGVTRNKKLIERFVQEVRRHLRPLEYGHWHKIEGGVQIRLQPAGHILGSAYVEIDHDGERVVFSGDLGSRNQPLLTEPASPEKADLLVLESTYGDRNHEGREERRKHLENILCRTMENSGVTIIPAFSVGRTQELLFEMNEIFNRVEKRCGCALLNAVDVIVDSPLANRYTEIYDDLRDYWSEEAQQVLSYDDQPLVFDNLFTINESDDHRDCVDRLIETKRPAIVIAAGGMCAGGRVVNYLKAFVGDPTTDVVFMGYQAIGTPGRYIQESDWVKLDGERYDIRAKVHVLDSYSAHADQSDLLKFVTGMQERPKAIRLVHGEKAAKAALTRELTERGYAVI